MIGIIEQYNVQPDQISTPFCILIYRQSKCET